MEAAQAKRQEAQDQRKPSAAPAAPIPQARTAQDAGVESSDENEEASDSEDDNEWIIQRYIPNPLTINGYKVDLRVYALCTSFDPLRLYVYNEGLVRFATHPYPKNLTTAPLDNVFCHLTNYSVNKNNKSYKVSSADDEGSGSKWTFHGFRRYFENQGWNWERAWNEIQGVVVKTFIAAESTVCAKSSMIRHRHTCFELYGFDIMLTDKFEAQLIEVNVMPSLATGSALDKHVKGHLIADMLTLVGIPLVDAAACIAKDEEQRQARRTGIPTEGNSKDPLYSGNNIECRPCKLDAKKFEAKRYLELHATEDDKAMIRDTEEEYSRRGGFHRVFPTQRSSAEFGPLFEIARHYNYLLGEWEAAKLKFSEPQRAMAVAWLNNEGPFPLGAPKRKPKTADAAPPRCASLPARPRVSATPKEVTAKAPILPPIQKQAIPVCTFTFIQVHK
jgi:tubulin polyglutamylase TTLL4